MTLQNTTPLKAEKYSILIVDDIPTNIEVLLDLLGAAGYEVLVALDGESAIEQVAYAQPDIVLLDVMMPGINGFETCRRLKGNTKTQHIPIIFMTALTETVDKVKGFELGAVDYITKPLQHEEVLARVNTHLTMQQLQHTLQRQNQHLQTLNNRFQQEMDMARQIQRSLLPPPSPTWPGLDIVCYSQSAREVGGDFYAYHLGANEGSFAVAVGDISGKGMPAALLMAISLVAFQNSVSLSHQPKALFKKLDQTLQPYTRSTNQNCALVYSHLEASDSAGEWHVTIGNAGCITPLLRRADGSVRWLDARGMPLGISDLDILTHLPLELTVNSGDTLVLTSDGVVEAHNPDNELFGFDRLHEALKNAPPGNAESLLAHLKNVIKTFAQHTTEHDDLTITVIHFE